MIRLWSFWKSLLNLFLHYSANEDYVCCKVDELIQTNANDEPCSNYINEGYSCVTQDVCLQRHGTKNGDGIIDWRTGDGLATNSSYLQFASW